MEGLSVGTYSFKNPSYIEKKKEHKQPKNLKQTKNLRQICLNEMTNPNRINCNLNLQTKNLISFLC